jgi:hypothetical protein
VDARAVMSVAAKPAKSTVIGGSRPTTRGIWPQSAGRASWMMSGCGRSRTAGISLAVWSRHCWRRASGGDPGGAEDDARLPQGRARGKSEVREREDVNDPRRHADPVRTQLPNPGRIHPGGARGSRGGAPIPAPVPRRAVEVALEATTGWRFVVEGAASDRRDGAPGRTGGDRRVAR